jgi:hypothetical protein
MQILILDVIASYIAFQIAAIFELAPQKISGGTEGQPAPNSPPEQVFVLPLPLPSYTTLV